MPEIGQTVSHYRIVEKIGQGGMGEVYLADDTTLDRKVALKFLPEAFTSDPERMARFEREAKLLASLNHTNIAGIYGLEQDDGNRFLVLEYVEGETLQARLRKGSLPLDDALALCRQITEGLEAAHEKGVIHRDLKPSNVMITAEEKVKILDFGLAKALADESQKVDPADSPTITAAMTQPGVVLGTAAYMSPEQAKGKSVDKRADIWAFGCILYECITGKRVFEGETVTETLAAILRGEPDWDALPTTTPQNIRFVLQQCFEKDKSSRFRDVADLRILIEAGSDIFPGPGILEPIQRDKSFSKMMFALAFACLVTGSIITGIIMWCMNPQSEPKAVFKFSINIPSDHKLRQIRAASMISLSPDGNKMAYLCDTGDTQQICLRRLDTDETDPIQGTEGGFNPVITSDGQWLVFSTDTKIMKVPLKGGAPRAVADTSYPTSGISCDENNSIVFSPGYGQTGLTYISDGRTQSIPLATLESLNARWPQFLPSSQAIIFTEYNRNIEDSRIMAYSMHTGKAKVLIKGGTAGRYIPTDTGHLVYAREGNLWAVQFDEKRLQIKGEELSVLDGVTQSDEGIAQFSFSTQGSLIYVTGGFGGPGRVFVWVDRNGREQKIDMEPGRYNVPRISPDGRKITLTIIGKAKRDIGVYDIKDRILNRFMLDGNNFCSIWTPDGKTITFRQDMQDVSKISSISSDGMGDFEILLEGQTGSQPMDWSPNGQTLVHSKFDGLKTDIFILDNNKESRPLLHDPEFNEDWISFSPDGQWIVYQSDEDGRLEVYIRPYPEVSKSKWQISEEGGTLPKWRKNGIYYSNGGKMMFVPAETDPKFKYENPQMLFEGDVVAFSQEYGWDVTADGTKFLMVKPSNPELAATPIRYVLNWFEELKQKVPVN